MKNLIINNRFIKTATRRGALLGLGSIAMVGHLRSANARANIKIGQIQALTGPSAAQGGRARDGAALAVEMINSDGGVKLGNDKLPIQLIDGDMANDPKQAITLFREYALDKDCVAVLGSTTSVGFVPLVPVAAQLSLPLIGNGAGAPIKTWTPWVYRVNPIGATALPVTLAVVVKEEKMKRLAVIYDQANDAQKADAEVCQRLAEKLGYTVVAFEAFRSGDQDFSPQIAVIKNVNPDAIFIATATGDGIKVVLQIRSNGLQQPLITGNGTFDDTVYWDGTRGGIKGGYTYLGRDLSKPIGKLLSWLSAYKAKFALSPTAYSLYGASSVWTLVRAIEQAQSVDRGAIRNVLASMDYIDPLGARVQFKNPPDGENLSPTVAVVRITGRDSYEQISA